MKVILTQDVKSIGKKGEVVEVSEGYANNFLFPKKAGIPATDAAMKDKGIIRVNFYANSLLGFWTCGKKPTN